LVGRIENTMATATPSGRLYHIQIRAESGHVPVDLREIARYRDLLLTLADRDIRVRYKQTALGIAWVILQPLIAASIFAFLFHWVANLPSNGRPYFLFAFAGLTAWNAFAQALTKVSTSLVAHAHVVSKIYFPRIVLPLSSISSVLVDFGVSLGMMFILLALWRVWPGVGLLLLPVWLAILLMMALGIGLWTSAVMVKYRDVYHILPTLIQLGMYVSPVAWSTVAIPPNYRWFFYANPLSGLLEAFRWSLLGTGTLDLRALAYSTVVAILFFWFGAHVFRRLERNFADVI
jgi:lipopolysaccharide transport system permease protein